MDKELKHYGVPGMKWGQRKAKPSGGSSSASVKAKKLQAGSAVSGHASNAFRNASDVSNRVASSGRRSKKVKKELSQMSDQELRNKINRQQMEQTYASMNPGKLERGAKVAGNILAAAGSVAAIAGSAIGIYTAIKPFLDKK